MLGDFNFPLGHRFHDFGWFGIGVVKVMGRESGFIAAYTAVADSQGHLRGKRVPVQRFLDVVVDRGVNIADAMFVFDIQNDLPDNEFINMDTGYLDCKLIPDVSTGHLTRFGDQFPRRVVLPGRPHARNL